MLDSPRAVTSLQRVLFFKRLPNLADLPAAELTVIADHAGERFFSKGSLLLREGEPVGAVHLIVEGEVEVRRRGKSLGRVGPQAGLGGLGLVSLPLTVFDDRLGGTPAPAGGAGGGPPGGGPPPPRPCPPGGATWTSWSASSSSDRCCPSREAASTRSSSSRAASPRFAFRPGSPSGGRGIPPRAYFSSCPGT